MWQASKLILVNAGDVDPAPQLGRAEDRWILSRLQRAIEAVGTKLGAYDFAHAALDLYEFFYSELCDWYLEIVKPRLYEGEREVRSNLVWVLEQTLALAHPMLPFVTEEIYGHLRDVAEGERAEMLVIHPFPTPDPALRDEQSEADVERLIALTRAIRAWRDLVEVPVASVLPARAADGELPRELVGRLARLSFDDTGAGERLATIGPVEILVSEEIDAEKARGRIDGRRAELRSEIARAEGKLANESFAAKAPPEVVEEEREKLERYRAELEELG